MKTAHVIIALLLISTASQAQSGFERYTVPYFDSMIIKDKNHPSYEFVLVKHKGGRGDFYLIDVNYKSLPKTNDAVSLMKNMLLFVSSN